MKVRELRRSRLTMSANDSPVNSRPASPSAKCGEMLRGELGWHGRPARVDRKDAAKALPCTFQRAFSISREPAGTAITHTSSSQAQRANKKLPRPSGRGLNTRTKPIRGPEDRHLGRST